MTIAFYRVIEITLLSSELLGLDPEPLKRELQLTWGSVI